MARFLRDDLFYVCNEDTDDELEEINDTKDDLNIIKDDLKDLKKQRSKIDAKIRLAEAKKATLVAKKAVNAVTKRNIMQKLKYRAKVTRDDDASQIVPHPQQGGNAIVEHKDNQIQILQRVMPMPEDNHVPIEDDRRQIEIVQHQRLVIGADQQGAVRQVQELVIM